MNDSTAKRALHALARNHPQYRSGVFLSSETLLAWAATFPDEKLLWMRNVGIKTVAWIRANQPHARLGECRVCGGTGIAVVDGSYHAPCTTCGGSGEALDHCERELDPSREVMGLPDAPAWLILHRIRDQGFRYALDAIDEVRLRTPIQEVSMIDISLIEPAPATPWEDGFRQGWRAAREAVERKLTASLNAEAERLR
jgi:hypothetical protein